MATVPCRESRQAGSRIGMDAFFGEGLAPAPGTSRITWHCAAMLLLALFLAQPAPATRPVPDIEVNVHATVREVRVRQRGETSLRVHASPDAGSRVETPPAAADGNARRRNRIVDVHAEARLADPGANPPPAPETSPHQRR
jgi:hypothetical protein